MSGRMNWLWTLIVPLLVFPAFAEVIQLPEAPVPTVKGEAQEVGTVYKWPGAMMVSEDGSAVPAEIPERIRRLQERPIAPMDNDLDELVWSDDFEGVFPGAWMRGAIPDGWDVETYNPSVGSQSVWCAGLFTDPGNNYPTDMITYMKYGPIDLSAYDSGTLFWDQWIEIENNWDILFVGVSSTLNGLYSGTYYSGLGATWSLDEALDVTPYCGGDLYIMFRFQSDASVTFEGAYIDFVRLNAFTNPVSDLFIEEISHTPMNPSVGQTVTTSVTIGNGGPDSASNFFVDLYTNQNHSPSYDGPVGDEAFNVMTAIEPGGSYTHSFSYSYPSAGVKHVWALVDWDEIITETDEDNNVGGIHDLPVGVASVITVTPAAPPIVIPPGGGSFNYSVSAVSYGNTVQRNGWITVTYLPLNNSMELLNVTANFNPNNPITLNRSQFVPSMAPPGPYALTVSVGNYPWNVHDTGTLFFTKQGAFADGAEGGDDLGDVNQWISSGDFFAGADNVRVAAAEGLPTEFKLTAPTPNPFNPTAQFSVQLPSSADLRVDVYDINGRLVSQLVRGTHSAGSHTFTLDGSALSSGVYFVRAATDAGETMVQKAILMK